MKTEDKIEDLERCVDLFRQAMAIYREASYQSHSGHWDATMRGGAGCPQCIRADELRGRAMRLEKEAIELYDSI